MLLQKSHGAGVSVGQDRLRPPFVDDGLKTRCDLRQRISPGDALEAAAAFGPDAAQGVGQPAGVVDSLEVAVDLAA